MEFKGKVARIVWNFSQKKGNHCPMIGPLVEVKNIINSLDPGRVSGAIDAKQILGPVKEAGWR